MKNIRYSIKPMIAAAVAGILMTGCASMFMNGGSFVESGYKAQKVIAVYRTEGIVPPGVQYSLVQTKNGQAIFEKGSDGSGTLFQTHWKDSQGDHFAGWVTTSHAYEFVIPVNRSSKGKKYVYPARTYTIKHINDVGRPVSNNPSVEPVATLIPK